MKTRVTVSATKTATYDRVIVNGRELRLDSIATVARGDTLILTLETAYPIDPDRVAILEVGQEWTTKTIFDYYAMDLARRRPT